MNQDLIAQIEQAMKKFSKGQRLIAEYILNHYEKAAYLTAARLGEVVGVSESTVVRFAAELGYDGYPKFQKTLQELIRTKLTAIQRMEITEDRIGEQNILNTVLQYDIDKIRQTLDEIDKDAFQQSIETILSARKIYILGVRSSASLASFLGFYLNLIFDNVSLINTTSVSEMFEQILRVSENDVVIGISFPRYSRRTIKALQYAKDKKSKVIAITDSNLSPLCTYADHTLIARSDMASFVDSLVAPLSVINALIVALGMRNKKDVYKTFESLEHIWEEYQVYEKYDDNN